jgi:predicted amidophosphoribosyltransferase
MSSQPICFQNLDTPIFAGARYSPEMTRIVLAAKEDGDKEARKVLVGFLRGALQLALKYQIQSSGTSESIESKNVIGEKSSAIYVIPIPSRASANRVRGFKHSLVLAEVLAATFTSREIIIIDCLILSRRIRDQAGLNMSARNKNIAGAHKLKFSSTQQIYEHILSQGDHEIYILDDLVTTGATITAAKLALASGKITISGVLTSCATPGFYALR